MLTYYIPNALLTGSLTLAIASLLPNPALSANFSRIYVFGDSLVETGNSLLITTAANQVNPSIPIVPPRELGYIDGRFANGDIWLDRLATRLNLPLPPVSTLVGATNNTGVNFSIGSATTGDENTFPIALPGFVGLAQQIEQFQGANPMADPNALYILWAGGQ